MTMKLKQHSIVDQFKSTAKKVNGLAYGTVLYLALRPGIAGAFQLSNTFCSFYKSVIDNELLLILSVIAFMILIVAWKFTKDNKVIASVLGLAIAITGLFNVEGIVNAISGKTILCKL